MKMIITLLLIVLNALFKHILPTLVPVHISSLLSI